MSMPKHIYLEAIQLASEYGRIDQHNIGKKRPMVRRMNEIQSRLEQIERAYTFDSDQEEQMV